METGEVYYGRGNNFDEALGISKTLQEAFEKELSGCAHPKQIYWNSHLRVGCLRRENMGNTKVSDNIGHKKWVLCWRYRKIHLSNLIQFARTKLSLYAMTHTTHRDSGFSSSTFNMFERNEDILIFFTLDHNDVMTKL